MPFTRQLGSTYIPGAVVDLAADTTVRYTCPGCGEDILRLPTGRMRYHGATLTRGRRCLFPEQEGALLTTAEGLTAAATQWPQFSEVYLAIQRRLDAMPRPKPHGGQLRRADPGGWRWKK